MPRIDNKKFYVSAIEKFGTTARGVNWASKKNQMLRFQKLLQLLPDDLNRFVLVDAGCGFGDFFTYLVKKNKVPKTYIGIDSLSDMSSIASQNTAQEILTLDITKEEIPISDYYICSGALNVLTKFETHQFIRNCYNSSKKSFIFNALYGDKESQTYNYLSKNEFIEIAKELNVKKVNFHTNYLENDITVEFIR